MNKVVIFGTSKYTDLVEHYFDAYTEYEVCGYTVDPPYLTEDTHKEKPVVAFDKLEAFFPPEEYLLFIAVGVKRLNTIRKRLYLQSKERGYHFASFIHPHALIDSSAKIGEHCIIMENVVVHAFCEIGAHSIFFPSSAITHHTSVGAHSFVSSGVVVGGCSEIGERAFVGLSTVIHGRTHIGEGCLISSGSVITRDLEDNYFLGRDGRHLAINDRSIILLNHLLEGI